MIPVVSVKGTNKKGVAISANGTDVYTFTAPVLKVGCWVVMLLDWVGGRQQLWAGAMWVWVCAGAMMHLCGSARVR